MALVQDPRVDQLEFFGRRIGGEPGKQASAAAILRGEADLEYDDEQRAELHEQILTQPPTRARLIMECGSDNAGRRYRQVPCRSESNTAAHPNRTKSRPTSEVRMNTKAVSPGSTAYSRCRALG
jgi:hypothetical protein